jgi:hypothetical protein
LIWISSLDETRREVRACDSGDVVAVWRRRRRPRGLPQKRMSQAAQPDGRWAPMHDRPFAEAVRNGMPARPAWLLHSARFADRRRRERRRPSPGATLRRPAEADRVGARCQRAGRQLYAIPEPEYQSHLHGAAPPEPQRPQRDRRPEVSTLRVIPGTRRVPIIVSPSAQPRRPEARVAGDVGFSWPLTSCPPSRDNHAMSAGSCGPQRRPYVGHDRREDCQFKRR